jgi:hypothetical protein
MVWIGFPMSRLKGCGKQSSPFLVSFFFFFFFFKGGSAITSNPGIRNPSGPFSLGYVVSYTVNDGDSGGCWFFLLAFSFFSFLNDTYQWGINRRLEAFANRAGQARG